MVSAFGAKKRHVGPRPAPLSLTGRTGKALKFRLNRITEGSGFHPIALWAGDWETSWKFYVDGFGFTPEIEWGEAPSRAVMLDTGDGNYLELFERDAAIQTVGEGDLLHLGLRCDDAVAATESARAAGATVRTEPFSPDVFAKMGLQAKIAFVLGPSGEIIRFFECPQL